MGSSLMLQIVNGKGKKGKREENKKKKRAFPLFIEALLEWPVKIYRGKPVEK